jgi:hypothetical protein
MGAEWTSFTITSRPFFRVVFVKGAMEEPGAVIVPREAERVPAQAGKRAQAVKPSAEQIMKLIVTPFSPGMSFPLLWGGNMVFQFILPAASV